VCLPTLRSSGIAALKGQSFQLSGKESGMMSLRQAYKVDKESLVVKKQQLCVLWKARSNRAHASGSRLPRALLWLETLFCIFFSTEFHFFLSQECRSHYSRPD